MRVHEAAKKLCKDSKEILDELKKLGISVKSHMSSITQQDFEKLESVFAGKKPDLQAQDAGADIKQDVSEDDNDEKQAAENKKKASDEDEALERARRERHYREVDAKIKNQEDERKKIEEEAGKEIEKEEEERQRLIAEAKKKEEVQEERPVVEINRSVTVSEFAAKLEIKPVELIKKLMGMGVLATMNQILSEEEVHIIADEYEREIIFKEVYGDDIFVEELEDESELTGRPPIVTIMGHVDHGKTSLLDAIRESNVADKEKGGITQKIGAYKVSALHGDVVFIDTPGHAAFTAMRARGAKGADIVILIVAADDGIMPQTIEAIDHAKAAGVPIIVAVNKIDKEGAQPDKIKQELTKYNLVPEEWGGKTQVINISAKEKTGLDALLEAILLESEMLELKTNVQAKASGVIIEGRLDKGRGAVGTV
ncbi:MAG TPA: GTP-binding protein, partial [Firmicutes bacterium]|nr:GTP-binding protein [Bacillota bacterium]